MGDATRMTKETAALICSHMFDASRPVLLVARAGAYWMYLCGGFHEENEEYKMVGREHLLQRDKSLVATLDLENQMEMERVAVGGQWERRARTEE
jgi:hypothetical protein